MHATMTRTLCALLLSTPGVALAASCRIDGGYLDFGRLDPLGRSDQHVIGSLVVACEGLETGLVRVSLGSGNASGFEHRELRDGPRQIRYNLYLDPAYQQVFGDDSPGGYTLSLSLPRDGQPVTVPIYAVVPRGQLMRPGVYSDQITVSVDF